jgi:hypothetical protein
MLAVGRTLTRRLRGRGDQAQVALMTNAEAQNTNARPKVNLLMPPAFTPKVSAPTPPNA